MERKLSINVNVAGRNYSLTIAMEEEENIRKAANIINNKVLQYRK